MEELEILINRKVLFLLKLGKKIIFEQAGDKLAIYFTWLYRLHKKLVFGALKSILIFSSGLVSRQKMKGL